MLDLTGPDVEKILRKLLDNCEGFQDVLREVLEKRGLGPRKLERLIKQHPKTWEDPISGRSRQLIVDRSTISRWLNGEPISKVFGVHDFRALASVIGCPEHEEARLIRAYYCQRYIIPAQRDLDLALWIAADDFVQNPTPANQARYLQARDAVIKNAPTLHQKQRRTRTFRPAQVAVIVLILLAGLFVVLQMIRTVYFSSEPTATVSPTHEPDTPTPTFTPTSPTVTPTYTQTHTPSPTPTPPVAAVMLGGNEELGPFLVGANRMTLYTLASDEPGVSRCVGDCPEFWPPLIVGSPEELIAGEGVRDELGVIEREDGSLQVTYNGMPLYFYVQDEAPGDTNGHGERGVWFVAKPE